jgi:excisionase family DNA binding protein
MTESLSTSQAARRLNLSAARIRQLLAKQQLPFVATPLGRLIDPAVIERLAAERERQSDSTRGER